MQCGSRAEAATVKTALNATEHQQCYTVWNRRQNTSFWVTVCKMVRPILSDRCLSVLSCLLSVTLMYCGQTLWRIKMTLGMQVGIDPGHIVLDGDPAPPPPKGHRPPIFGPYQLRPNGCIDQDATWYGGRPRPLNFWPMFIIVIVISLEHCTGIRRYWFVQVQVKF